MHSRLWEVISVHLFAVDLILFKSKRKLKKSLSLIITQTLKVFLRNISLKWSLIRLSQIEPLIHYSYVI